MGSGSANWRLKYDDGDPNDQGHYDNEIYNGWPDPATFTDEDREYSIYATYTPEAAAEKSIQTPIRFE